MSEFRLPATPPANAHELQVWAYLEQGVIRVMTHPEVPLSAEEYTSLHSAIFNYFTASKARRNAAGNNNKTNTDRTGGFLYRQLSEYLVRYLSSHSKAASTLVNTELLEYYAKEWKTYSTQTRILSRLFEFLNCHWVKCERDEGNKDVYPINNLAYIRWKKRMLPDIQTDQQKLTQALLNLIEEHRKGGDVDLDLVKKVTETFISVDIDGSDLAKLKLTVYKKNFEDPFLAATEEFYTKKSSDLISLKSISDYLAKATSWLREEEDLAERFLHPSTRQLFLSKCEDALILKHMETLWAALPSILDSDKDEPRINLYSLLSRNQAGVENVRTRFSLHAEQDGRTLLLKLVQESPTVASSNAAVDSKAYTHALLDLNTRYTTMISQSFGDDIDFRVHFQKTFKELVNRNSATGFNERLSAEAIGQYAKTVMKEGSDADSKELKKRIADLSQYLEAKDIFEAASNV